MKLKDIVFFFLIIAVTFPLSGCSRQKLIQKEMLNTKWVSSQKEFPDYLAGVWLGEGLVDPDTNSVAKWGIKFESDGSISKIDQPVSGKVNVYEGSVYLEGPDKDMFAYFILGPCELNYNAERRVLKAHIVIDEYMMKLPTGTITGRLESFLKGPVSRDGKTWRANWYDFGWLDGADAPDPNVVWANPVKVVFKKADIKDIEEKVEKIKQEYQQHQQKRKQQQPIQQP